MRKEYKPGLCRDWRSWRDCLESLCELLHWREI